MYLKLIFKRNEEKQELLIKLKKILKDLFIFIDNKSAKKNCVER